MALRWKQAVVALMLSALSAVASAQVRTTGQIVGTVKDATGAVIQQAQLVLIDSTTGITFEATSAADGGFVFPNLQPGTYTLSVGRTEIAGDVAYAVWSATTSAGEVRMATDTFVVRDDKIVAQTAAFYLEPK